MRGERGAERLEVHGQEREVAADVADPQPGIELHAVDDLDPVLEEHMLRAEVAMAFTHQAGGRARLELTAAGRHEALGEAGEGPNSAPEVRIGGEREQRVRVLGKCPAQVAGGIVACDVLVEGGEPAPDGD